MLYFSQAERSNVLPKGSKTQTKKIFFLFILKILTFLQEEKIIYTGESV